VKVLKSCLTPHILALQQQQIIGSLLYRAQLRSRDDIQGLQVYLDYDNSFLKDQLDRPQISLMALIRNFNLNDIIEIWEIIGLSTNTGLEILQRQSIMISTTFQQQATEIIVPDLHIRYAKGFGKMKKALNLVLDFGFDEELINMITLFVDKKMNINVESASWTALTKRLKSSSENQSHDGSAHIHHAMNPQDPNLRISFSNINPNNSHAMGENRRKYVCNICGGSGHNAYNYDSDDNSSNNNDSGDSGSDNSDSDDS
ncbi:5149_t:CDS:2, partial [Gigaspora rosea]